jgi:hypothetical protein
MSSTAFSILAPVHLLAYSTLLGTELFQTFVITKVAYQALPRSAFTTLQKRVFPIYFKSQSLLLFLVAVTIPPHGPFSILSTRTQWVTFLVAGVTAGFNFLVYGPKTRSLMIQRVHQGISSCIINEKQGADMWTATRDAQLQFEAGALTDDMKKLNRSFSRAHAMSIHLNLITIGATLLYGWRLATKLTVDVA